MRRIDPENLQPNSRLKNVAGLIQNLSYREMEEFAGLIQSKGDTRALVVNLLHAADTILAKKGTLL